MTVGDTGTDVAVGCHGDGVDVVGVAVVSPLDVLAVVSPMGVWVVVFPVGVWVLVSPVVSGVSVVCCTISGL